MPPERIYVLCNISYSRLAQVQNVNKNKQAVSISTTCGNSSDLASHTSTILKSSEHIVTVAGTELWYSKCSVLIMVTLKNL